MKVNRRREIFDRYAESVRSWQRSAVDGATLDDTVRVVDCYGFAKRAAISRNTRPGGTRPIQSNATAAYRF